MPCLIYQSSIISLKYLFYRAEQNRMEETWFISGWLIPMNGLLCVSYSINLFKNISAIFSMREKSFHGIQIKINRYGRNKLCLIFDEHLFLYFKKLNLHTSHAIQLYNLYILSRLFIPYEIILRMFSFRFK